MKKRKRMGEEGFSLVELVVVIVVTGFLVLILAPQMLKYVERSRVSSDELVADSVRLAVLAALLNPSVLQDEDFTEDVAGFQAAGGTTITKIGTNAFGDAVAENLGEEDGSMLTNAWVLEQLESKDAEDIMIEITGTDSVQVTIKGSHADASGGADEIVVK